MLSPSASQSQSNASFIDTQSTQSTFNTQQSRRRPRPAHQSHPSFSASQIAHPPKKSRQRSISAQRELNASPEAQAAVLAVTQDVNSLRSAPEKKSLNVEWAKNSKYVVAQAAGLPMELRDKGDNYSKRMAASTDAGTGSVLLMKDSGAYVWRYEEAQPIPKPDHFPLPHDESLGRDSAVPLPLGSLVSPVGSSDEAGFVVVMPVTGRIAYWDAVSSAMTEGLLSRRRGVEGHFTLSSHESVQSITSIEPAGFILCTTTGRIAHLSLRDGVGKPEVQVTTLKSAGHGVVGGLLGGIASAFKAGNMKKEIVAVRPGRLIGRAERELLVMTARGHLTRWEISRNSAAVILSDVDLREQILARVLTNGPPVLSTLDREDFQVLDVASSRNTAEGTELLLLTAWNDEHSMAANTTHYALVLVCMQANNKFIVKKVHTVSCYQLPPKASVTSIGPKLYLPNPYRTAFVVFARAILVVSIIPEDFYDASPDIELPDVAYNTKTGFEDVIDFKPEHTVEIIGSGMEELSQDVGAHTNGRSFGMELDSTEGLRKRPIYCPSILVVTKGAGLLKISVFDVETGDLRPQPSARPVPVKSKMELAVFFGANEKNLLNFKGRPEIKYPIEDVESAARELSKDIICSHSRYLSATSLPSIDVYLEFRAQRLRILADYLIAVFPPMSRQVKWKLCWDAEKLEAARAVYTAFAKKQSGGKDLSEGILREVIIAFLKENKSFTEGSNYLRDWFAYHIPSLWMLMPHLRESYSDASNRDVGTLARRIQESNEIILTTLSTAQRFRAENAELYGLQNDVNELGIPNFQDLEAAPWTSSPETLTTLARDLEITSKLISELAPKKDIEGDFLNQVTDQLVELVETTCRNFVERASWCESQKNADLAQQGKEIRDRYLRDRKVWIKNLSERNRGDKAVDIAERYHDYRTLVELAFEEISRISLYLEQHTTEMAGQDEERKNAQKRRDDIFAQLDKYFENFGQDFAFTLYEYQIEEGDLRELLLQFSNFKSHLDAFLHTSSHYAKLQWINDVSLGKYHEAGQTLVEIAEAESDLWCKSVELSISKLALMIGQSKPEVEHITKSFDTRLKLIDLQQQIYDHLYSEIRGAIDLQAAVELAVQAWGDRAAPYHSLRDIFRRGINRLVTRQTMDADMLIDVLTMKVPDGQHFSNDEDDWSGSFQLAFEVLESSELDKTRVDQAVKSIWRRLYLTDDWSRLLEPSNQSQGRIEANIITTNAFEILKYVYKKGIFSTEANLKPMSPSMSYFDQSNDWLRTRFPEASDEWIDELSEELQSENKTLQEYVEVGNIDFWFPWMCEEAQRVIEEDEADFAGETSVQSPIVNGEVTVDSSADMDDVMDMS